MNRQSLSQKEVRDHFEYDEVTGDFTRILGFTSWGDPRPCNELILTTNNRGYKWLKYKNLRFLVHRLIFLYMTGKHPKGEVDHIDGDRLNNKWSNLRDVSAFENSRNQGNRKDNGTGVRGVTKLKNGTFKVRISHRGVRYDLGTYKTILEAKDVRLAAESDLNYHMNHGKRESWRK